MKNTINNGVLTLYLTGHIDSSNANDIEAQIMGALNTPHDAVVFDLKELAYISSAGLRILLKVRKRNAGVTAINASSAVYDIFEVTGFAELIPITKAMREISIEGCSVVGEGANGIVYRIGRDTIVKVDKKAETPEDIQRERELCRAAFVLGVPTAIAYDVVKVGDAYGAVFELLDAKSLAELMCESADNLDFVAQRSVEVAKIMHSTPAPDGLPDEYAMVDGWIDMVRDYLTVEETAKFHALIAALPRVDTMIHGDFHIKNLMQQGDETLLIDMDTLSVGHPIFELAFMYNAYKGFGYTDPDVVTRFMGFDSALAYRLWRRMLSLYVGTSDEAILNDVEDKAALIGLLRLLRRSLKKIKEPTEADRVFIDAAAATIKDILSRITTLEFEVYA